MQLERERELDSYNEIRDRQVSLCESESETEKVRESNRAEKSQRLRERERKRDITRELGRKSKCARERDNEISLTSIRL